jgi:hypothetical protein
MKVAHNYITRKAQHSSAQHSSAQHSNQTNQGIDLGNLLHTQEGSIDSADIKRTLKAEINTKLDALHKRFSLQSRLRKMAQGVMQHAQLNGLKLNRLKVSGLKQSGLKQSGLKGRPFLPKPISFPSSTQLSSLEYGPDDELQSKELQSEEIPKITGNKEQDAKLFTLALSVSRFSGQPIYVSNLGSQFAQFAQKLDQTKVETPLHSTQHSSLQQKALSIYLKNSSEANRVRKVDVAL